MNMFITGKSVALSTRHNNHAGGQAIDGIYLPSQWSISEQASMAHTKRELSPWIQIDLLTNHFVYGVKIWNRSESPYQGSLKNLV